MLVVTINDKPVSNAVTAARYAGLTKTSEVAGASTLAVLAKFADAKAAIDAIEKAGKPTDVIYCKDEGKTPRPRKITRENLVRRMRAALLALPLANQIAEITKSANGLVEFISDGSTPENTTQAFEAE